MKAIYKLVHHFPAKSFTFVNAEESLTGPFTITTHILLNKNSFTRLATSFKDVAQISPSSASLRILCARNYFPRTFQVHNGPSVLTWTPSRSSARFHGPWEPGHELKSGWESGYISVSYYFVLTAKSHCPRFWLAPGRYQYKSTEARKLAWSVTQHTRSLCRLLVDLSLL